MNSSGTLICGAAKMGDTLNFTVDHTGVARYPIGSPVFVGTPAYPELGTSSYSTDTGLGITTTTTPTEAINKIDTWIETYMLDAPPSLTAGSASQMVQYVSVSWTNPVQKRLAFMTGYIPQITAIVADIVPTFANASSDWSAASTWSVTLETVAAGSLPTVTSLSIMQDYNSGTSNLNAGAYSYYGTSTSTRITQGTKYDIRVYAANQATAPGTGSKTPRYITFRNIGTLAAGSPGAPTSFAVSSPTTNSAQASWSTVGMARDSTSSATPYITQYQVNVSAVSSIRYGGVSTSGLVTPQTTSLTAGSDASTSLTLTNLNPGSGYSATVQGKNALNASFGSVSSSASFYTSLPTAPAWASSTLTISNASSLQYGSGASGYQPDGTTSATPIFNYYTMTTSPPVSSSTTTRLNFTTADTSATIGSIVGWAGQVSSESNVTATMVGYGRSFASSTNTNGAVRLSISNEGDAFTGVSSGFYKTASATVQAVGVSTMYTTSLTPYDMWMVFAPLGTSSVTTQKVSWYVDALNSLPSVVGGGLMSGGTLAYVTGVPGFVGTSTFNFRATMSGIMYQFLRSDLKHLEASIETVGGTSLSSVLTIAKSTINGSTHSYYAAPSQSYGISATKHNTSGIRLAVNPGSIQFNDFTLSLTGGSSVYSENLRLRLVPYNLQGTGSTQTYAGQVSTANGASSNMRIDTTSIAALASMNGATLLSCGSGPFPLLSSLTSFDHTASIVGTSQLQMINGQWQTSGAGTGYKDYSAYSVSGPNYASISGSGFRYVCVSFTNLSGSTYDSVTVTFGSSGLTLSPSTDTANFQLYIKVVGETTTPWVSCTASINPTGYSAISLDGQGAMNNSLASVGSIYAYVPAATLGTATIYLRFGLDMAVSQSVWNVACTSN